MVRWIIFLAFSAIALEAQQTPKRTVNLVNTRSAGAISVPVAEGWHIDFTNVYDDGTRPVLQLSNEQTGVTASVSLFDNYYKKPDPAGCRKDATDGVLAHQAVAITGRKDFSGKAADGTPLAYTSWVIHGNPATILQRNFFAFASDAQTCYEIHVSKILAGKPVDAELEHALQLFHVRLHYQPNAADEMVMASLLNGSTPALAATYYREALNRTPAGPQSLTARRVLTDELVVSLGMGGDLKDSRAVAQQAIEIDPDYPLNYYNLACADAETGNATEARIHLEQAYARKQNVLKGESMPDPTKDDSLLKLKSNAEFWAYVQTLR